MENVIPERLMKAGEQDSFLAWVRGLRIPREDKKQLLRLWADRVGVKLTGDIVKKAGIERR